MNQLRGSNWRRFLVGCTVIGIILSSATGRKAIAAAATETSPAKVTVGLLPPFPFYWASYVAQQREIFKDQRLDVEVIQLSRPSEAVQALIGGSLNFAWVSADAFINGIEAGGNVAIIGQAIGNPAFSVVVQPGIKSWSEVKGKTVAVSAPKDGAAIIFRLMAQPHGLKENDYTFISVGTTPNRYAALQSKAVDVAIMGQPQDFLAAKEGFRVLGRSDAVLKNYSFVMIGTNKSWAANHRDTIVRYLASIQRAVDWLYNPANKKEAIDILLKALRKGERETMERIYSIYFEESGGRIVTRGAEVDMEGLRIYAEKMKELQLLKRDPDIRRWIDLNYLKTGGK
jgi:ABC-type nitrate/sulfonate/bicarbonate transport system substrate-binding protein